MHESIGDKYLIGCEHLLNILLYYNINVLVYLYLLSFLVLNDIPFLLQVARITFTRVDVSSPTDECFEDFVDVFEYEDNFANRLEIVCTRTREDDRTFFSNGNNVIIAFVSNGNRNVGEGFTARIEAVQQSMCIV